VKREEESPPGRLVSRERRVWVLFLDFPSFQPPWQVGMTPQLGSFVRPARHFLESDEEASRFQGISHRHSERSSSRRDFGEKASS